MNEAFLVHIQIGSLMTENLVRSVQRLKEDDEDDVDVLEVDIYLELVHYGWSNNPGAEDAEPVILIPVGFPCLERGRPYKKICARIKASAFVELAEGRRRRRRNCRFFFFLQKCKYSRHSRPESFVSMF